jgi:IS1 family transposase
VRQFLFFWLFFALVVLLPLIFQQLQTIWSQRTRKRKPSSEPKPRVLKPKTDQDCPGCRAEAAGGNNPAVVCTEHIVPWSLRKGIGGKKKSIRTHGFFCSNPCCYYYLIEDETLHAFVGDGTHGKYERIQDLRCQFCHKKFTVRRHTVLYRLKTLSTTVAKILHLLVVGVDISAVEEVFGIREMTLRTWLSRSGLQAQKLHQRFFADLELGHVQLDELWANLKQANQDLWVWVACDAKHKLIPVLQIGPRTQQMAYQVVHELKNRLKTGCVSVFSTDGLKHYFYALTAHFGEWLPIQGGQPVWTILADFAYAQVIKQQKRFRLVKVEQRNIWGLPREYAARLKNIGLSGIINTSFVERVNLTIRQFVSKLTRRTWGPAHFSPELNEHLFWWLAYYHFVRQHESLKVKLEKPMARKGKQNPLRYRQMTPALAAGLTTRRWTCLELICYPLP